MPSNERNLSRSPTNIWSTETIVVLLRRQQGVEQRGLRGQELQPVSFDFSQFGEACVTGQPFLGKNALRPVIQLHILFPAAQRRQQLGQTGRHPPKIPLHLQIEPIDVAGQMDAELAGTTEEASFGRDLPAGCRQLLNETGHPGRRQRIQAVLRQTVAVLAFGTGGEQQVPGSPFRLEIAAQAPASLPVIPGRRPLAEEGDAVAVSKRQPAFQMACPTILRGGNLQLGSRRRSFFFPLQFAGPVSARRNLHSLRAAR